MEGYITTAVAKALKAWEPLKGANVFVVNAIEGDSVVVNTTPPAVAVHVRENNDLPSSQIGGQIRQRFDLALFCILPLTNYTFSPDSGLQAKMLDITDEVLRCMEMFRLHPGDTQIGHDWNLIYGRTEHDTAYGTGTSGLSIVCRIHKLIYECSVEFDLYNTGGVQPGENVQQIDLDTHYINEEDYAIKQAIP